MAKGASSKQIITNKLLEVFPGSFLYNDGKEIRIPMNEEGEQIQIKVALTCAKVNVESGDDTILPGSVPTKVENTEMTENEIKEVRNLIDELGL